MFVLFTTFKIDRKRQLLKISVNKDFKFILNELVKNFTRFDLHEFIKLDSKYSKTLYRLLKQYRSTGRYEVGIEKFKEIMDSPNSYSNKHIMDKIIKASINELNSKSYFQNLTCIPKYAHRRGRPVIGYIFTFTPEICQNKDKYSSEEKMKNSINITKRRYIEPKQRKYDYEEIEKFLLNNPLK